MKKVLITVFEPYKNDPISASCEIAKLIKIQPSMAEVMNLVLPVEFGKGKDALISVLNCYEPNIVIMLGQSVGKASIRFERVAINIASSTIDDNIGYCPNEEPINPLGPDAYFSTLPIVQMKNSSKEIGIPADISNSAGTYLCNYVYYLALDWASRMNNKTKVIFIHFPLLPEQVIDNPNRPSMNKSDIAKGITASILPLITDN